MNKTILVTLTAISLILSGCDQRSNDQECRDKVCPQGYTKYYSTDCGLGPNGPVPCPPEIKQQQDCQCHKECWKNKDSDCPAEMPKCRAVLISDSSQYLCFEE